ncbi:MAG: PadR family transcriptional regulator [Firmicutes bacterium HGW-Firmicutes-10]|jgi:DNA-binding PadR family transcriptional regulator|nr:MAG: PadR family transcriptional regulator [Firmicutes bacterium HGW-Firmicutes-10]
MKDKQAIFCNDKSHHMERFLEVCLLLLLYDEIGYGYGLIEQLVNFGFSPEDLNVSTLYRTLRKMEGEGLVTSLWEESDQGPKRRVYEITLEGKENLDQWIKILKMRKSKIENLIVQYDKKIVDTTSDLSD